MKFAVFGVGGVGGYFGGRLAEAGQDVTFVARGESLRAIRENGLRVDSILGDFTISPAQVNDDPNSIGPVDVVILGVKAGQVVQVADALRPLIGPNTCVLPLQNGVEAPDHLAKVLGAEHVLGGLCGVISFVARPGHIQHIAENSPFVTFGELDNKETERTTKLQQAFQNAKGVTAQIAPDIRVALWQKLMIIVSLSGVGAVTRATVGQWRSIPESRRLYNELAKEVFSVARSKGIGIPDEHLQTVLDWPERLEPEATTSLQRDIAAGLPSELKEQLGVIVRTGRETETNTPIANFIYSSLLPSEMLARN